MGAERLDNLPVGRAFGVQGGEPMTKGELLETIQRLLKADYGVSFLLRLEEDLALLVGCIRERVEAADWGPVCVKAKALPYPRPYWEELLPLKIETVFFCFADSSTKTRRLRFSPDRNFLSWLVLEKIRCLIGMMASEFDSFPDLA